MAKQPTKAELERQLNIANKAVHDQMKTIDSLHKEIEGIQKDWRHRYDGLLEQLSLALRDQFVGYEFNQFGTVNHERLQALTVQGIFFKIGRLTILAQEYEELKDRTLPLPKQKILDQENNRNGA